MVEEKKAELAKQEDIVPSKVIIFPVSTPPVFPGMTIPFFVPSEEHIKILDYVAENNEYIGIFATLNKEGEMFDPSNIDRYGILVKILKKLRMPDGSANVLINGVTRIKRKRLIKKSPFLITTIEQIDNTIDDELRTEALFKKSRETLGEIMKLMPSIPREFNIAIFNIEDAATLSEFVAQHFEMPSEVREKLVRTGSITKRLEEILIFLTGE